MINKNKNKALVRSAVLLGITPFLSSTNCVCSAGGGPGFSSNKDNLKLNFKIAKLVSIKSKDAEPGDVLMTGVDGFLLEKGENGDYGYRRYETLEKVRNRLPKDEYERIKAKFNTNEHGWITMDSKYFEQEQKEIKELGRRRKVIWVPAEKIMKLVQIENVTKEVLGDIENNIIFGKEKGDEVYVTKDGKHTLEYVYKGRGRGLTERKKEIGYYEHLGWPSEKTCNEQGIYTVDLLSHRGRHIKAYGGPPLGVPLID